MLELKKIKPFIKNIDPTRNLKSELCITNGHYLVFREFVSPDAWAQYHCNNPMGELSEELVKQLATTPDDLREIRITTTLNVGMDIKLSKQPTRLFKCDDFEIGINQNYLELLESINVCVKFYASSPNNAVFLKNLDDKIVAIVMPVRL